MGEQTMPNPNREQAGKQNQQRDRESASRQPGRQLPGESPQPNERASNPNQDMGESDAARRQARQDPLQNRGR